MKIKRWILLKIFKAQIIGLKRNGVIEYVYAIEL